MVRREEQPWESRATLFLDTRVIAHRGQGIASSLEAAVSAAASIAVHLGKRGFTVRLVTAAGEDSANDWHTREADLNTGPLLEALAVVQPLPRPNLDTGWLDRGRRRRAAGRGPRPRRPARRARAPPDARAQRFGPRRGRRRRRVALPRRGRARRVRRAQPAGLARRSRSARPTGSRRSGRSSDAGTPRARGRAASRPRRPRRSRPAPYPPARGCADGRRPFAPHGAGRPVGGRRDHHAGLAAHLAGVHPGVRRAPWARCSSSPSSSPAPARSVAGGGCPGPARAGPGAARRDGRLRVRQRVAAADRRGLGPAA